MTTMTRTGGRWSEIVNEAAWDEDEATYTAIEAQMPEAYGDIEGPITIEATDAVREAIEAIEAALARAEGMTYGHGTL